MTKQNIKGMGKTLLFLPMKTLIQNVPFLKKKPQYNGKFDWKILSVTLCYGINIVLIEDLLVFPTTYSREVTAC